MAHRGKRLTRCVQKKNEDRGPTTAFVQSPGRESLPGPQRQTRWSRTIARGTTIGDSITSVPSLAPRSASGSQLGSPTEPASRMTAPSIRPTSADFPSRKATAVQTSLPPDTRSGVLRANPPFCDSQPKRISIGLSYHHFRAGRGNSRSVRTCLSFLRRQRRKERFLPSPMYASISLRRVIAHSRSGHYTRRLPLSDRVLSTFSCNRNSWSLRR